MRRATQSVEDEHAEAMVRAERQQAKAHLVAGMLAGQPWREAAASAGLAIYYPYGRCKANQARAAV